MQESPFAIAGQSPIKIDGQRGRGIAPVAAYVACCLLPPWLINPAKARSFFKQRSSPFYVGTRRTL
jgi:hypothetical protein